MENTAPNTNNFLNWVEIKNFKSIKDLRLDCKRVNVFIGKPNVGKSNILEGLGLLGIEYSDQIFLKNLIRYREIRHLFYENNNELTIAVKTDKCVAYLKQKRDSVSEYEYYSQGDIKNLGSEQGYDNVRDASKFQPEKFDFVVSKEGIFNKELANKGFDFEQIHAIKKYDFMNLEKVDTPFSQWLLPPNGSNLFNVVDRRDDLKEEFGRLFREQGLEFVLDREAQAFELQRRAGYYVYKFDYYTIADTFRRFMFYITAIESNKNAVIVFEEPEVHSFPPYTQEMAYRMIYDEDNQYFISTHSPYLLHTLIENLEDDQLNVYITYYENYETKAHALTTENLRDILDFGTDVFFNLDKFIPNAGRPISA
ncbi:ATP/GTP-binding protein [Spirosoma migulaei]